MNSIEELSTQQKRIWFQQIRKSKFAIGFVLVIAIILSWNIYRSTDKIFEHEKLFGILVGIHQIQSNLGSSTTMLSIKLNNGENVMVRAPANLIVKEHAEVEIIRGKTQQGSVYYYFSNYRDSK